MVLLHQPKQHEEVSFFFSIFLVSKENSTFLSMGNTMFLLLHHHRHWGKPLIGAQHSVRDTPQSGRLQQRRHCTIVISL